MRPVVWSGIFVVFMVVLAACAREVDRPTPVTTSPTAVTTSPTAVPVSPIATPTTSRVSPTATPRSVGELMLDVRGPADGSVLRTGAVVVHGVTSPSAKISINGAFAAVDGDGRFQAEVALTPGAGTIQVTATGVDGSKVQEDLKVTYLELPPQPFFLLVTEPEDQSIVSTRNLPLSGRTSPDAVVSINGVSVGVDDAGIFSTSLTLDDGPNIIDVLATNVDGEILSTVLAVIFRP